MTTLQSTHPAYRPDIDGLRGVAVLSVVAFHAFPSNLQGGFIGVDVFFVISGFLISSIIFENLNKGTFSFRAFYARRIKRIFPALFVVLLACLCLGYYTLIPEELNQLGKHVAAGAGFVSNFVLWNESGYFDNAAETKPLLHLWSLGIEEQFYIFWPLLVWAAWKCRLNLLYVIVFLVLASFSLNIWFIRQDPVATFYSPLTRMWEILCGALVAWFTVERPNSTFQLSDFLRDRPELAKAATFAGKLILVLAFITISGDANFPGAWALVPVVATMLIIIGGSNHANDRDLWSNKILVWFGLISFPLYLWHWPILSFGRILYFDTPPLKFRIIAIVVSILLAWLTVKLIEKPIRFGRQYSLLKVFGVSGAIGSLALAGVIVSRSDFSETHTFDKLAIERKDEHAVGSSLRWFRGKSDWLFLGNSSEETVAKLKLAKVPSEEELNAIVATFNRISETSIKNKVKTILIVAPDKSSVYPEFLPDEVKPSATKYISFFTSRLNKVPNLLVYNSTNDLLQAKKTEGFLYWKTDTHWNNKGAFLTFAGFSKLAETPIPEIDFKMGGPHPGDLITISELPKFPVPNDDNWDVVWKNQPVWTEAEVPNQETTPFGKATIVTNDQAPSNQTVWVVGDSFVGPLKQYFNATFSQVYYAGHWKQMLDKLPDEINKAEKKPDLVVIVKVERSF